MTNLKKVEANLYVDESGIYIWREYIAGIRHWRSTGERTLAAARTAVKTFRIEAGEGKALKRKSFAELFDELEKVQAAKAKNTLVTWRTAMTHLRPWFCGEKRDEKTGKWLPDPSLDPRCAYLSQFEAQYETLWATYKTDQAELSATRKLGPDRRALLMALKRAKIKGYVRREFKNADLQLLESSEDIGRLVEDDELERLLPLAREYPRLYAAVMTALFMGNRKTEILRFTVPEMDFRRGEVDLRGRRTKTRKARKVLMHVRVKPLLKELADEAVAHGGTYLFPSQKHKGDLDWTKPQVDMPNAWDKIREQAKSDCRFHDLRHTAISWMISDGIPLPAIHMQTGASMKVILRIYAHLDQKMREKVRTFSCGKFVGPNETGET